MERRQQSLFDRATIVPALIASLAKLDPRVQRHNPVMSLSRSARSSRRSDG